MVSSTLQEPLDWPNATVSSGDAVEVVARLKEESDVPLRSHGSLSMNRALMAAGLVDRVQVTLFPVITGQTGLEPIFAGAADFDLELLESRTFDGRTQELVYRPTLHWSARDHAGLRVLEQLVELRGCRSARRASGRRRVRRARPSRAR